MGELLAIADRLYAEPPATFTATRDALARAQDDKALGRQVKALRKPSVAAWAINLLVRREGEQIDQVLGVAEALREAASAMDGAELRSLTRQRRQLTTALAATARSLAWEHDVRLTAAVVDQVEGMLNAAMLDPVAASVVRSGLVLTGFTSTGVGELEVDGVVAVPEGVGFTASSVEREPPQLSVVPEDDAVRRARASDALAAAEEEAARARDQLTEVEASLAELGARRLQLAGEIDETKRRLAALETELDGVEDDLEDGEAAQEESAAEVSRLEAAVESAREALAAFD